MWVVRIGFLGAAAAALVGCAAPTKPDLPEQSYNLIGEAVVGPPKCAEQGYMTPEAAARIQAQTRSHLARHTYDESRVSFMVSNAQYVDYTKVICTSMAIRSSAQHQESVANQQHTAEHNAEMRRIIESNRMRNTYCNRIGTQVFCNTQ